MKNRTKILSAIAMVCAFGIVGGITAGNYNAKAAEGQVNVLDGFTSVGASVRLDGEPQMRFEFTLSGQAQTDYAEKIKNGEVQTGIVYMPYDLYTGELANFTLDAANSAFANTTADWNVEENETHLTSYGYVLASDVSNFYNRIMIARAYLTDGETTYYSSATAKASMAYLAWVNYDAFKGTYQEQLDAYRGEYTLTYNGAPVFSGAYGDTVTIEAPAVADGYAFDGWFWDEGFTNAVADTDYITGSYNVYAKFHQTTFSVSAKGFALQAATVTLTAQDGTKHTLENVSGSEFAFENLPNGTYTAFEIDDGFNAHYFYGGNLVVDGANVELTEADFVKDPLNYRLKTNAWTRQTFARHYNETDGVYYTVGNPANGAGPNTAMYEYAPVALEASNKATISYDVTVTEGGPLCIGFSLGAHRSTIANGTITPWAHAFIRLNASGTFEWDFLYDYNQINGAEYQATDYTTKLFWSGGKPTITGFGDTFNVKMIRDNGIVALFIDDSMVYYINEAEGHNIVNGGQIGETPLYYAVSVRSNNVGGTGAATFKNIQASNTADIGQYLSTVSGTNADLANATLKITGQETISGRNITITKTCVADANGNFAFAPVPYGNYTASASVAAGNYSATFTANSAAHTVDNWGVEKIAEIGAVSLAGQSKTSAMPTDAVYSNGGKTIAFSGVSTGTQQIYTLKNTVTLTEGFTYEATITGTTSQLTGACIANAAEQISVMFAPWENGNVVIQAVGYGSGGNDFVLTGVDDVIDDNKQINATVKFVQTGVSSVAIYVNNKLVCTITSAGFTLGDGISYFNDTHKANAENVTDWWGRGRVASRYLTRDNFVCGFTGYMKAEDKVTYTVNFTKNA